MGKVVNYLEVAEMLMDVYNAYAKRILKKIDDPYLQALVIVSYRTSDLKQLLDLIKKTKDQYYEALAKGYLEEAYYLYQKIQKILNEFETKIIERILDLVRIYAIYIIKNM